MELPTSPKTDWKQNQSGCRSVLYVEGAINCRFFVLYPPLWEYTVGNSLIFNTEGKMEELWSLLGLSMGLGQEHILDFLWVDYASVWECEFTILECVTVIRSYEVSDTLTVFQMLVQVGLKPVYALCHSVTWCEVAYIHHTVSALYEETEYECFYFPCLGIVWSPVPCIHIEVQSSRLVRSGLFSELGYVKCRDSSPLRFG